MRDFLQDLRYASRTLGRSWALTLVIVISLAISIGANSAIFSVVNALLTSSHCETSRTTQTGG